MNPYLSMDNLCSLQSKGNQFQEMGIKVPKSSVKNPFQLYLNANQESVTNVSLVYSDGTVRNNIYDPMTDQQLQYIKEAIQQSNTIDGSVYYFNVNVIDNTLNINNFKKTVLSIDLNPMKQIYNTPEKFNQFLKNIYQASKNILS
jgi:hypothetical protein